MRDVHPFLVLSPQSRENNPFAVRYTGPGQKVSYILSHQPKSYDWRSGAAKPHPWKQVPADVFTSACERLNQIIDLGM